MAVQMAEKVKEELQEQRNFFSVERRTFDKKLTEANQLQARAQQENVELENQLVAVRKEMVPAHHETRLCCCEQTVLWWCCEQTVLWWCVAECCEQIVVWCL